MALNAIRTILSEKRWVFDSIFPRIRKSYIQKLTHRYDKEIDLSKVPSSYLSSAFYRGTKDIYYRGSQGIPLQIAAVSLIDSNVSLGRLFWEEAVKESVTDEARLAAAGPIEKQRLCSALQEVIFRVPELGDGHTFMDFIVLYEGSIWMASTKPVFLGALFVQNRLVLSDRLVEDIVHEMAHQELFCLNLIDRLVKQSADHKLVYAPFQKRDRPTIGRLHAAHSLYRTCQFLEKTGSIKFEVQLKYLVETLKTLEPSDLTEFGNFLLFDCYYSYTREKEGGNRIGYRNQFRNIS